MTKLRGWRKIQDPIEEVRVAFMMDYRGNFHITRRQADGYIEWGCKLDISSFDRRLIDVLDKNFNTITPHQRTTDKQKYPRLRTIFYRWSAKGTLLDYLLDIMERITISRHDEIVAVRNFRKWFHPHVKPKKRGRPQKGVSQLKDEVVDGREKAYNEFKSIVRVRHKQVVKGVRRETSVQEER